MMKIIIKKTNTDTQPKMDILKQFRDENGGELALKKQVNNNNNKMEKFKCIF